MLSQRHRLRTSAQFGQTLRSGSRFGSRNLVVFLANREHPEDPAIAGFLVSKKVGNAVVRNRVKRRLRESVKDVVRAEPSGYAMVVRALPGAAGLDSAELDAEFRSALSGAQSKLRKRRS